MLRLLKIIFFFFRDSIIKTCTKNFTLNDLHESIHLTNMSVQNKYTNDPNRNPGLPQENQWDSNTFIRYLK